MKIKELITEYKASPNILISMASKINANVGIEFEMCVPDATTLSTSSEERDDDMDTRCNSIEQIIDFFNSGDYNSYIVLHNLRKNLENSLKEYWKEDLEISWSNYGKTNSIEKYLKTSELENEEKDELEENLYNETGPDYEEMKNDWIQNVHGDPEDVEEEWLGDEGLNYMSDVEEQYDLIWPYYEQSEDEYTIDLESVSTSFRKNVSWVSFTSQQYHGAERSAIGYSIEPDSSIDVNDENDVGLEFISPPMSFLKMNVDLAKIIAWASKYGCYTNSSTGLHINVSLPGFNKSKLDYTKLALMLGDNYILDKFERGANSFCKPALGLISGKLATAPELVKQYLSNMKDKMAGFSMQVVSSIFSETPKYTSINLKNGYIEFRSPGGDWLNTDINVLQSTIARFIVALDAACDPEKMKHQYLKKLYILLSKYMTSEAERDYAPYISEYLAGQLSQPATIQFFREIQSLRTKISPDKKKLPLP